MAYSDDELLSALKNCYSENGKVTTRLFQEFSGPSTKTVINRFGSFNNALLEAEIPINDTWNERTDNEILSDVRTVAKQNGSIRPKYFGGDFVSRGQIDRKFGSISLAAGKANCHKYLPDYVECDDCGGLFTDIGNHISGSSCQFRKIPNKEKEIYTGILLGDGCISGREHIPWFTVSMSGESGREFTKWLQNNISIKNTRSMRELESNTHKDVYTLRTQSHTYFDNLSSWYESGKKKFPKELYLTPTILKMWYICDGTLSNDGPKITCWNESNRSNFIVSLFDDVGLSVTWQSGNNDVYIRKESQKDFFNYIGSPPPGFEYKWN